MNSILCTSIECPAFDEVGAAVALGLEFELNKWVSYGKWLQTHGRTRDPGTGASAPPHSAPAGSPHFTVLIPASFGSVCHLLNNLKVSMAISKIGSQDTGSGSCPPGKCCLGRRLFLLLHLLVGGVTEPCCSRMEKQTRLLMGVEESCCYEEKQSLIPEGAPSFQVLEEGRQAEATVEQMSDEEQQ
ncbi:hypothetical protein H8959_004067 [Pygathrix nigripes]